MRVIFLGESGSFSHISENSTKGNNISEHGHSGYVSKNCSYHTALWRRAEPIMRMADLRRGKSLKLDLLNQPVLKPNSTVMEVL